jgi:hypothetical protein
MIFKTNPFSFLILKIASLPQITVSFLMYSQDYLILNIELLVDKFIAMHDFFSLQFHINTYRFVTNDYGRKFMRVVEI